MAERIPGRYRILRGLGDGRIVDTQYRNRWGELSEPSRVPSEKAGRDVNSLLPPPRSPNHQFPGAKDRHIRTILKGPMRGKKLDTRIEYPAGPVRKMGRKFVGQREHARDKYAAEVEASFSDKQQRLERLRAAFYSLPG
jgi:hypothetical protein